MSASRYCFGLIALSHRKCAQAWDRFRVSRGGVVGLALLSLAGCQAPLNSDVMLSTTKYTLEQTEKLRFLDSSLQSAVTSTGIQHSILADGRLQVVVNMRNRVNRAVPVQLSAFFTDQQGLNTGEETAWIPVTLGQNSTEAVRFVSKQTNARNFTIRVRAVQ